MKANPVFERVALHLNHAPNRHISEGGELGLDGRRLAGEPCCVQIEHKRQRHVPPIRAPVARVAPALALVAGEDRAVRVERAGGLGEALAVRVGGAGRALASEIGEVPDVASVAEAGPPLTGPEDEGAAARWTRGARDRHALGGVGSRSARYAHIAGERAVSSRVGPWGAQDAAGVGWHA